MIMLTLLILAIAYTGVAMALISPLNTAFGLDISLKIDRVAIVLTLAICWPVTIAVCGLATIFMVLFDD